MNIRDKDNVLRIAGWTLSLLCMIIGSYFLWPHIHVALLGVVFFYLGVRVLIFLPLRNTKKPAKLF